MCVCVHIQSYIIIYSYPRQAAQTLADGIKAVLLNLHNLQSAQGAARGAGSEAAPLASLTPSMTPSSSPARTKVRVRPDVLCVCVDVGVDDSCVGCMYM